MLTPPLPPGYLLPAMPRQGQTAPGQALPAVFRPLPSLDAAHIAAPWPHVVPTGPGHHVRPARLHTPPRTSTIRLRRRRRQQRQSRKRLAAAGRGHPAEEGRPVSPLCVCSCPRVGTSLSRQTPRRCVPVARRSSLLLQYHLRFFRTSNEKRSEITLSLYFQGIRLWLRTDEGPVKKQISPLQSPQLFL
jgi:hypothetical protein